MIRAYNKLYLEQARRSLGFMFDYAVRDLAFSLQDFWQMFIHSEVSVRMESGDPSLIAGRSGAELALCVLNNTAFYKNPSFSISRSPWYWTGWAIAYYQWFTGLPFRRISDFISIDEICELYNPYHEMDIRHFCDRLDEARLASRPEPNIKQLRTHAGLSQSQLSALSDVPLRTIQQYEQRQKNINHANAEYILSLSNALFCEPKELYDI